MIEVLLKKIEFRPNMFIGFIMQTVPAIYWQSTETVEK